MSEQPSSKDRSVEYALRQVERCRNYGPELVENEQVIVILGDEIERLQRELAETKRDWLKERASWSSLCHEQREQMRAAHEPEVIPDATRKLGELASAHILLRTALSQITVQRLRGRKTSAGLIAEDALDKTASAGHLAVALGTTGSNTDLDRYRQALYRANGFLIQHGIEPVKLEYNTPTKGGES